MKLPKIYQCNPAVFRAYYMDLATPPICVAFLSHEQALNILAWFIEDPEGSRLPLKLSIAKTKAASSSLSY
jgi:hypothetical protein